jgi:multidrug resistance protein
MAIYPEAADKVLSPDRDLDPTMILDELKTDQDVAIKESGTLVVENVREQGRHQLPIQYGYLEFSTHLEFSDSAPSSASLERYRDPLSWSRGTKIFVTWLSCLSTFVTTYTPGAYTAGLDQYKIDWGVSTTAVYGGITTFTILFAIAPLVLSPFSEITGRRPVFLVAGVLYCTAQIGSAVTRSYAGMLVTRALAGLSCSVFSTMVGGVISDIYVAKERNTAMAIFSGAALVGCGIGPMVSGIIAQHLSWRWIFYVQTITCSCVVLALFLSFPETRGSVLLSRRAVILNAWYEQEELKQHAKVLAKTSPTPSESSGLPQHRIRWKVKADEERATLAILIKTSLTRPLILLFTESVVFWFSMWMAFAWTMLYLTFEALPLLFTAVYNFNNQANGLVFLSVAVASVLAAIAAIWQDKLLRVSWLPKGLQHEKPENRLYFPCIQSLLLPIGLFWLANTVVVSIHWIVPVLAVGCITLGIFSVYLAVFNYLADTYHVYASSAIAAQSFTRNVFAACVPLATEPLFNTLGFRGGGCLLGGIGLVLSTVPWILVVFGERIRRRSQLACQLAGESN